MFLQHEARRINVIGVLLLTALTLAAGIAVYVVMQRQAKTLLSKSLQTSLHSNVRLFESQLDQALGKTGTVATRPYPTQNLQLLATKPGNAKATAELQRIALSFLPTGFSGMSFFDVRGREVARAGHFSMHPDLLVPLKAKGRASLIWDDQFILRVRMDMLDNQGRQVGSLITESYLPLLTRAFDEATAIGQTSEFGICGPLQDDKNHMDCFLRSISGKEFRRFERVMEGVPLPMDYALNGETGLIFTMDYRREEVVAAYVPVGKFGLGMVLKVDQAELYYPAFGQLKLILPLLAVLVFIGLLLLNVLVAPLVRKLVIAERSTRDANIQLQDSEARTRVILERVDEGIVAITESGQIVSFNPAAERIFSYTGGEIIGQNVRLLLPEQQRKTHDAILEYYLETKDQKFIGSGREAVGLRKDNTSFPMEISTSEVQLDTGNLFIIAVRDISSRKQAEQRIVHLATHDALTDLPNRNLLQDRLQQVLGHIRRNGGQGAVLFIDLDRFKDVNDSTGHDAGDQLLKQVAKRLVASLRNQDTVARQGGDEFIVVLPNVANALDAGNVAQTLLSALQVPYLIEGKEHRISASIGIAGFPDDGGDADTLLKHSDTAMYFAKESGRNNFQFFARQMNQQITKKQALGADLSHAVERGELLLHYQPIVDMTSNKLVRLEALLRWQHPVRGLIPPLDFIPLAEEIGLIEQIGEWVLKSGCTQLNTWQAQGYDIPQLAINLSTKQFRQKTLVQIIANILQETGIEARFVELEITESILMDQTQERIETLRALSNMGLKLSLDDFGTGYSSLSYLKRYPIDTLKIDRSFVQDIVTNPDDAAIVAGIIGLAHSLRMPVIAEGVETEAQRALLAMQGCDLYQGYYFSKPLPASEIVTKLQRKTAA